LNLDGCIRILWRSTRVLAVNCFQNNDCAKRRALFAYRAARPFKEQRLYPVSACTLTPLTLQKLRGETRVGQGFRITALGRGAAKLLAGSKPLDRLTMEPQVNPAGTRGQDVGRSRQGLTGVVC
jgi:hypothetical protein